MPSIPIVDKMSVNIEILLDELGDYNVSITLTTHEGILFQQKIPKLRDHVFAHVQGFSNAALTLGLNSLARQLRQHKPKG